jgi:hypothetical protein
VNDPWVLTYDCVGVSSGCCGMWQVSRREKPPMAAARSKREREERVVTNDALGEQLVEGHPNERPHSVEDLREFDAAHGRARVPALVGDGAFSGGGRQ